ncbi:AbrB/MazE/SpoVT family DNA-binding domain-containing protein [Furfurilactobacillus milii]|nr:AbrB/MazE/SpoVT family DNA-binding domain-containing protein [Furfurilactobacillus milii]
MTNEGSAMTKNNFEPLTTRLSSKGQVVIPAEVRKQLGLSAGDQLSVDIDKNNNIVLKSRPTPLEWHDLIKNIPIEDVDIDKEGHYDPQKSPHFDEWMREK